MEWVQINATLTIMPIRGRTLFVRAAHAHKSCAQPAAMRALIFAPRAAFPIRATHTGLSLPKMAEWLGLASSRYTVTLITDDGTKYRYMHLDMDELAVVDGQLVTKGQRLGKVSQMTFSRAPVHGCQQPIICILSSIKTMRQMMRHRLNLTR